MNLKTGRLSLLFALGFQLQLLGMELSEAPLGKRSEPDSRSYYMKDGKRPAASVDQVSESILRVKFYDRGKIFEIDKEALPISGFFSAQDSFMRDFSPASQNSEILIIGYDNAEPEVCECFVALMKLVTKLGSERNEIAKANLTREIDATIGQLAVKASDSGKYQENVPAPLLQELLVLSKFMLADQVESLVKVALAREVLQFQQRMRSAFFLTLIEGLSEHEVDLDDLLKFSRASVLLHRIGVRDTISSRFSPDGRYLAVFIRGNSLRIIDMNSGEVKREILYPNLVNIIEFSPDSFLIATNSFDNCIRIINVESGVAQNTITCQSRISSMVFSCTGQLIKLNTVNGPSYVIRVSSGQVIQEPNMAAFEDFVNTNVTNNSTVLRALPLVGVDFIWRANLLGRLKYNFLGFSFSKYVFSKDNSLIACLDSNRLFVVEVKSKKVLFDCSLASDLESMQFSLDGSSLILKYKGDCLSIVDVGSGKSKIRESYLRFHESDSSIALECADCKTLKIIDKVSGNSKQKISHNQKISFAGYSPEGKKLVTLTSRALSIVLDSSLYDLINHYGFELDTGQKLLCAYVANGYQLGKPVVLRKREAEVFRTLPQELKQHFSKMVRLTLPKN